MTPSNDNGNNGNKYARRKPRNTDSQNIARDNITGRPSRSHTDENGSRRGNDRSGSGQDSRSYDDRANARHSKGRNTYGFGQGRSERTDRGGSYRDNQDRPARSGQGNSYRDRQDKPARSGQGESYRDRQDRPARSGQGNSYRDRQDRPARSGQGESYRDRQDRPARSGQGNSYRDGQDRPARSGQGGSYRSGQDRPARFGQRGQDQQRYSPRSEPTQAERTYSPQDQSQPEVYTMDTAALSALENAENTYSLVGINAVWEALKAEKQIDKLLIDKELNQDSIAALLGAARRLRVKLEFVPRTKLDVISQGGRHQGVIAYLPSVEYVQLDDILSKAQAQQESAILMVLDQIQDPHNLGAIIRSAECAGACGVVITEHSSVGLTPAVTSSSAGAIAHIPICKVINLAQAIEQMQEKGFWVLGADSEGEACYSTDMRGDTAIVIGNEGSGLRKLVRERCDALVGIPMVGQVRSLNASVAAGVLLFEAVRQQRSNQT